MTDISLEPVTIQPKVVYGIKSEIQGNIHFTQKREIIYPVESVLAFHDYVTNKQKFLRLPENIRPLIISISPNRRLLAVFEEILNEDEKENPSSYNISIYDLTTLKKRKNFVPPETLSKQTYEIAQMIFTQDSHSVVLLTKPPEETIILYKFDKLNTQIIGRAAEVNQHGFCDCIASNPQDSATFAIGGENLYKIMSTSEKGFVCSLTIRKEGIRLTSLGWLNIDTCIAGTSDAKILIYEGSELKSKFNATDLRIIDLTSEEDDEKIEENQAKADGDGSLKSASEIKEKLDDSVTCITLFPKGFAYAVFNKVYVFEKESRYKYSRKTILTIPIDIYPEHFYKICNLSVNSQQDTVIVTAKHNQIYFGKLIVPATLKTQFLTFKPLGESIHNDEIIDISICAWRPIILSASKDKTVRIWNYETGKIELIRKFQADITCVELNPNGFLAAIGFFDQLRIMEIFLDDFKIIKTYNFPQSKDIRYSNFGHLMAVAYDNLIAIVGVYNLETLKIIKGHNGDVLSLSWSRDDKYLISGGKEGAIYQWDVETGVRVNEVVQKGIEFRGIAVTNKTPLSIYTITSTGTLREIQNSSIVRELETPTKTPLLSVTLAKSDLVLFLTNEKGNLFNCQLPFELAGGGNCTNYRFFNSPITKCSLSYDGTLLITASGKGTLAIWAIKNLEGRVFPIDCDLLRSHEVLVPHTIMQDKIDTIANLELRLKQQVEEYEYKRIQNEAMDEQQMAGIHQFYCDAITDIKNKSNKIEIDHVEELNHMAEEFKKLQQEHTKELNDLADEYSERMLNEYYKFTNLREKLLNMRDSYEDKLRGQAICLQDTIEALEMDFKKSLQERQELIRQLIEEMEGKKNEFIEYCRQVEQDNDINMLESKLLYEKKLKVEKDTTCKWRGEAGVYKKKFESVNIEANDLREEVEELKNDNRRYKREIEKQLHISEDLRHELEERDFIIGEKEKRIQELMRKNQELEKYKQVLSHKITELRDEIEPREQQIKEKRNQIIDMERELEGLHNANIQSDLQVKELKDKYLSATNELKLERQRSKIARNHTFAICTDIYHIASNLNRPDLLKEGVKHLFRKYSNDDELKKAVIMEETVQTEFDRQRGHLERIAAIYRKQVAAKAGSSKTEKLIKENVQLIVEANTLRTLYKEKQKQNTHMERLIGVSFKTLSSAQIKHKIEKTVSDVERFDAKHKRDVEELQGTISELVTQNRDLRVQVDILETRIKNTRISTDSKDFDHSNLI